MAPPTGQGEDEDMDPNRANRRPSNPDRRRTLALATAARRRLDRDARPRGRAWINGREVGGAIARFDHLGRSYD